jgi:chemotaxis protein MotB
MSRKRNKGHGGEHENSERWLLTYADMITLLMAFFIMMYSMSVMNLEKFNAVAFSIRSGFGGVLKGGRSLLTHPSGQRSLHNGMPKRDEQSLNQVKSAVETYVTAEDLGQDVDVERDERGVVIRIAAEKLLFKRGTDELTRAAPPMLKRIAEYIKPLANNIIVEGFTCDLPISTARFPSNWELSGARASRVVRFLEEKGVASVRLSAVGYGETRPRFPNNTEAHRMKNRRVDIVILDSLRRDLPAVKLEPSGQTLNNGEDRVRPILPKVWREANTEGEH